jgi:cation diffusion facilitator CzcD-associated flavoprotein CzcO
MSGQPSAAKAEAYDVVVGAGFAGMYMLHRLRGLSMTARAFEQGSGVGGTWYWIAIPARVATSRAYNIRIPSPKNCSSNGTGASATRRSRRF